MKKIILASTSPRRKELMELFHLPFESIGSNYEEDMTLDLPARELVMHLALGKAEDVAKGQKDALVIGGDTIVVLERQVLGKPHTPEKAREMLEMLRGQTHKLMTGLAIIDTTTGEIKTNVSISEVTFRNYSDREISNYIKTGEPLDRAGAYAIQGYGSILTEKIDGDYSAILGLSVSTLAKMLREFDVDVWESIAECHSK